MASINGVSIKNYKVQKVDFNMFPNAETDAISSGDIYVKGKAICHFAEDINGGGMSFTPVGMINHFDEIKPAFYRWKTAVLNTQYIDIDCFIYDITTLIELEKFFVKNSKQKECTLFASFPINGFGVVKGHIEQGSKNLTEKKKIELEVEVLKELSKYGSAKPVNYFTKAYRKVSDFDIVIGDEKEGKIMLQEELDRQRKAIEERLQAEKAKQEQEKEKVKKISAHFNAVEVPNEPFVYIEDNRTGKKSKVALFAYKEVVQVLKDLDL